jgi:hypothetical protein
MIHPFARSFDPRRKHTTHAALPDAPRLADFILHPDICWGIDTGGSIHIFGYL